MRIAILSLTVLVSALSAQKHMAITVDDLPLAGGPRSLAAARTVTARILSAFRAHGVSTTAFVNERQLQVTGERDAWVSLLEDWLDAGHTLGNHTFSHPDLNNTTLADYQDDVIRGEVVTRALMRQRGHTRFYFRHPFTHTGETKEKKEGLEEFLAGRAYTIAPFTVEHADYWFADLWRRLNNQGDQPEAEKVRAAYLAHLNTALSYYEALSHRYFDRDIAQILLIHANALNAECLPAMLDSMKRRGYRFVTLDQALEDPAYHTPDRWIGRNGPSWLHRWSVALGQPFDLANEPDPPKWLFDLNKATPAI
jgi:peptidoglycan/xylan/chitin deacetylase (PgdA/CDA1 family)